MSLRYRDSSGNETIVSGLTPGGDIEAGAVDTRSGVFSFSVASGSHEKFTVTFDTPMIDNDYIVDIWSDIHNMEYLTFNIEGKRANGFDVNVNNAYGATINRSGIKYKAYKVYTVQHATQNAEDIANIKAVIPSAASSTNKLATSNDVSNLATSTDSRLDDLEDLVPTNASVTNQLVTRAEINNVYTKTEVDTKLDGKQDTLTFDNEPTAGSGNPVKSNGVKAALDTKQGLIFKGTKAEWNALSLAQKTSYTFCVLTDDTDYNDNIVDSVTNGNMYAVTSNAVYDYIQAALSNFITVKTVTLGDITIPANGYYQITNFLPTPPTGKALRFVQVHNYGQGGGAISVDTRGSYISATPNKTYTAVSLSYFYW